MGAGTEEEQFGLGYGHKIVMKVGFYLNPIWMGFFGAARGCQGGEGGGAKRPPP